MSMNAFLAADILLPRTGDMQKWAVIACDQFTSDQSYWDRVRETAKGAPSTINLILPEAELGTPMEAEHTAVINATMAQYMKDGVFAEYPASYVYVERTLENGSVRKGLVGMVDLDAYDYTPGATSAIRATERTVPERIPPRQRVRRDAPIELPHILMLCDDHANVLIEPVGEKKASLKKLYDFDLMEGGGHIEGYLVDGENAEAFDAALREYRYCGFFSRFDSAGIAFACPLFCRQGSFREKPACFPSFATAYRGKFTAYCYKTTSCPCSRAFFSYDGYNRIMERR